MAHSRYCLYPLEGIIFSFSPEKNWNFSSGNLDFYKGSLVCGWLSQRPLGILELWPRGSGTGSQAAVGTTVGTEVCLNF